MSTAVSLAAAFIGAFLAISFLVKSLWLVETEDVGKREFKERYGTIIEELNLNGDFFCRYYYPFYMLRRLFYAITLVGLTEHPLVQLSLIPAFLSFPVLWYLVKYAPFDTKLNNGLNIYNEAVVSLTFIAIFVLNVYPPKVILQDTLGWIMIALILLSLIATWIITLPPAFKELYVLVSGLCGTNTTTAERKVSDGEKPLPIDKIETSKNAEVVKPNDTSGNMEPKEGKMKSEPEKKFVKIVVITEKK